MDTEYHSLPRLERSDYQGTAVVLGTITLEDRVQGWLEGSFHSTFRELLLHAAFRQSLLCPAYTVMPDPLHLVWMGLKTSSDQILAMRFLRLHLQQALNLRAADTGLTIRLQKQSHDRVLRENQRKRGAFADACRYVLCNPHRGGLVADPMLWPYSGSVVPGFPDLSPFTANFWPIFWRAYEKNQDPLPSPKR